jgi:hypothetical protein
MVLGRATSKTFSHCTEQLTWIFKPKTIITIYISNLLLLHPLCCLIDTVLDQLSSNPCPFLDLAHNNRGHWSSQPIRLATAVDGHIIILLFQTNFVPGYKVYQFLVQGTQSSIEPCSINSVAWKPISVGVTDSEADGLVISVWNWD